MYSFPAGPSYGREGVNRGRGRTGHSGGADQLSRAETQGRGAGWNGIGAEEYLGIAGQGVSGLFVASGFQLDWPNQLFAQLAGIATITIFASIFAWVTFKALHLVVKAWTKAPISREEAAIFSKEAEGT